MRYFFLIWLLLSFGSLPGNEGLLNVPFISQNLTSQGQWAHLHGASKSNLGAGMIYYAIVYANKAKVCVCLGSGDGFVPRVMRQAQRDLELSDSKTILVDGNMGDWGRPIWLSKDSKIRSYYPEIDIILDSTLNVANNQAKEWKIDYLHIDADRTTKGALKDFVDYLPFMNQHGTITIHDTGPGRPCSHTVAIIKEMGFSIINYEQLGTGTSIIVLP